MSSPPSSPVSTLSSTSSPATTTFDPVLYAQLRSAAFRKPRAGAVEPPECIRTPIRYRRPLLQPWQRVGVTEYRPADLVRFLASEPRVVFPQPVSLEKAMRVLYFVWPKVNL